VDYIVNREGGTTKLRKNARLKNLHLELKTFFYTINNNNDNNNNVHILSGGHQKGWNLASSSYRYRRLEDGRPT